MKSIFNIHWYQVLLEQYPKIPYFISVARIDKPIGVYLLLWPTLWGLWIAAEGFPGWHLFIVFCLGTFLTRSAGCVINDIVDRNYDQKVKRTRDRPLAQGKLSVPEAIVFTSVISFLAFILVLTTNLLTLGLALMAAVIATAYPFMKRFTYLPQVVLGIAFSFGIPMAFAATQNQVPPLAWLLLVANVVWTVAYDTQYAMVDRDDDRKIGLKSTAILFGDLDRVMIGVLQIIFIATMLIVVRHIELGWPYFLGLAIAAGLFFYQQVLIKNRLRSACFTAFLNNHWVGLFIFMGILIHFWLLNN